MTKQLWSPESKRRWVHLLRATGREGDLSSRGEGSSGRTAMKTTSGWTRDLPSRREEGLRNVSEDESIRTLPEGFHFFVPRNLSEKKQGGSLARDRKVPKGAGEVTVCKTPQERGPTSKGRCPGKLCNLDLEQIGEGDGVVGDSCPPSWQHPSLEPAPRWPPVFPPARTREGHLWGQQREIFLPRPFNYTGSTNAVYVPNHWSPCLSRESKPKPALHSPVHLEAQWGTKAPTVGVL